MTEPKAPAVPPGGGTSSSHHIIDEGDRWRLLFQFDRRRRVLVALIPKDVGLQDVVRFTEGVLVGMRRKIAERQQREGNHHDGEVEGSSESKVPGADAAGEGEEKTDPEVRGPEGGEDPST